MKFYLTILTILLLLFSLISGFSYIIKNERKIKKLQQELIISLANEKQYKIESENNKKIISSLNKKINNIKELEHNNIKLLQDNQENIKKLTTKEQIEKINIIFEKL